MGVSIVKKNGKSFKAYSTLVSQCHIKFLRSSPAGVFERAAKRIVAKRRQLKTPDMAMVLYSPPSSSRPSRTPPQRTPRESRRRYEPIPESLIPLPRYDPLPESLIPLPGDSLEDLDFGRMRRYRRRQ